MTRAVFASTAAALLLVTYACSAGTATAPAAETAPASISNPVGPAIEQLEREWVAAIVKNDADALDRLLADDFVGTSATGATYDKTRALSDLKSGTYAVKSMNLDEVSANVYGNAAVAFTSQQEESSYAGQDNSGHYHYTNVWIRNNDRWRVVASHGSRFAQAQ
jgi:ketosteroid isomerase-like protein